MKNCPLQNVQAIFLSDGSKVMGIGDQGIGGASSITARKDIYVAVGGFDPWKTLPI